MSNITQVPGSTGESKAGPAACCRTESKGGPGSTADGLTLPAPCLMCLSLPVSLCHTRVPRSTKPLQASNSRAETLCPLRAGPKAVLTNITACKEQELRGSQLLLSKGKCQLPDGNRPDNHTSAPGSAQHHSSSLTLLQCHHCCSVLARAGLGFTAAASYM